MMEEVCPYIYEIMAQRPKTVSKSTILNWVAEYYDINYTLLSSYWARWKKNPEGICFLPPELAAYINMRVRELSVTRKNRFVHGDSEWLRNGLNS